MEGESTVEGRAVPVAHVDIEHSRNVGFQSAQASAHFVYSNDAGSSGRAPFSAVVSGARNALPEPGRCQDLTGGTLPTSAPVLLLEAGAVVIHTTPRVTQVGLRDASVEGEQVQAELVQADETAIVDPAALDGDAPSAPSALEVASAQATPVTISLAPRAFPGVSSLASGVMYTSRDREIPLPASAEYRVDIEGSTQVPAMSLHGVAPAYLRHVTVGGMPLEQVESLSSGSPIDLTWDIGHAADMVVVDVTNPLDGRTVLRCSYSDAAGAGTVPWVAPLADLVLDSPKAELHVHRVRLVEAATGESAPGANTARGQLRFDFELTRDVEFR